MIQRLQSLWLLLAAFFALLTYKFPFYNGSIVDKDNQIQPAKFTASFNIMTLILTAVLLIIILTDIFLFKNRKLQLRVAIAALVISILNLVIYFSKIGSFTKGELSLASVFSFFLPVFLFLAARGIWKDEKLIKSLDRLR